MIRSSRSNLLSTPLSTMTIAALALGGCGVQTVANTDGVGSEIATSVVSGGLNNTTGSTVAINAPWQKEKRSRFERLLDDLSPVRPAWAATWSCTGGSLAPPFSGPGADPYMYTPMSCMVTWKGGKTASSSWSGAFVLNYGTACDATHPFIGNQAAGCTSTRTTATGGNTRTITGPDGGLYAVTHDTNGVGTGWDTSVTPAPSSNGVVLTCASAGCSTGVNLVINGSHLTATVTPAGGSQAVFWNHTVSTGQGGITVTGEGVGRVASGTVTVQHNLAKFTTTSTFSAVGFGDAACCFPTAGTVTTTYSDGPNASKTESLSFSSAACGEATLTKVDGSTAPVTLQHCI